MRFETTIAEWHRIMGYAALWVKYGEMLPRRIKQALIGWDKEVEAEEKLSIYFDGGDAQSVQTIAAVLDVDLERLTF